MAPRGGRQIDRVSPGAALLRDIDSFDRQRYMVLATFRRSGAEVRTPVWFAAVDGRIYVFTAGESGKVKRLRHSSRARIAPSDMRGQVRGVWWDVAARIVTAPGLIERAHTALRAKYRWRMRLGDLVSRLTGRIQHRTWIEIEI
ncbi:MAG TPA: PPOX class F420-dependent oxidoreductase [Candidatus Nitrosotalea sp.]|nr:PPOX class F420-dependent oxidoreductase [Candidatus Nitrosotalea sp.]